MARKTEKGGKFRNVQCRTWNMARKLKIMENEKHPLDDLKNDEITKHCRTWNMARKVKIMENEKHPLDDLKNDEISKIREK
ncbi:Uncharacterised protein [Chlamydia abortus]|nr:Uncharacterised protein [Chlamydia abortus]